MLVDSNIFIYSINKRSPKHKIAQQFLKENQLNLDITHQNILEVIRVLTHRKFSSKITIENALNLIIEIVRLCRVISPNQDTIYVALELIKLNKLKGNRIFDAYLTATAVTNGIFEIATDNTRDFTKFPGIKIINPFIDSSN